MLDAETDRDLLIFQVDLFSARGPVPETLLEAAEREKDIRYSSRTRMNTDKNRQIHNARRAVRDLIEKLPEDLQRDPSVESPAQGGQGKHRHRRAPDLQEQELRDSRRTTISPMSAMVEHWNAGVRDVICRCGTKSGSNGRSPAKPW